MFSRRHESALLTSPRIESKLKLANMIDLDEYALDSPKYVVQPGHLFLELSDFTSLKAFLRGMFRKHAFSRIAMLQVMTLMLISFRAYIVWICDYDLGFFRILL